MEMPSRFMVPKGDGCGMYHLLSGAVKSRTLKAFLQYVPRLKG